jgi:ABC-type bacteriocin/lantibiotic exporter with double-glycine peptidase domain
MMFETSEVSSIWAGLSPAHIIFLKIFRSFSCSISLLLFATLFSCSTPDKVRVDSGRVIEGVPYYPQERYQCGPASLASVLNYWGIKVSPEEIASDIYSKTAKGTLDIDMISYVLGKGLEADIFAGGMKDITRSIDEGNPLIVLVDYGFWVYQQNHFMVVVGYNSNGVIVNSGSERLKFILSGDFMKLWKKTNFWILSVRRKN